MKRAEICNFSAGPSMLPTSVLNKIRDQLLNYNETGMSVMELSHRSSTFEQILTATEQNLRKLLNIPSNYQILFMQGGGTTQFSSIPLNFCEQDDIVSYCVSGVWSSKAAEEAKKYAQVQIVDNEHWSINNKAKYLYYCDNETINGIELPVVPPETDIPLICDMSSNFLSRRFDITRYAMIFAGAQKNFGIAGLTIVIIRSDFLQSSPRLYTPTMLNYSLMSSNKSMYNTPPTFAIYVSKLVTEWLLEQGGIAALEERNAEKARMLYETIDASELFFNDVDPPYRSRMNVIFKCKDASREKEFIEQAEQAGLYELVGHRSVGGFRASLYNAVTREMVDKLCKFIQEFR